MGLPLPQAIGFFSFIIAIVSIWVHMEISIAELNIENVNLKQNLEVHKVDNRKDFDDMRGDIKEILRKIDEIQIYLRNRK